MTHLSRSSRYLLVQLAFVVSIVLVAAGLWSAAQTRRAAPAAAEEEPTFRDYRGVQIGWMADDVRKKLGNPANKDDEQDFYVFNEKETAQILYDKTSHKVTAISVDFEKWRQR